MLSGRVFQWIIDLVMGKNVDNPGPGHDLLTYLLVVIGKLIMARIN